MTNKELKEYLDFKVSQYESPQFIIDDPIQIPKQFSKLHDIEVIGLIVATISWGNRKSIIKSGEKLISLMNYEPYAFVMDFKNSSNSHKHLKRFVHRTFNHIDLLFFIKAFKKLYKTHNSLEEIFTGPTTFDKIASFRNFFLSVTHTTKSKKHLPNVLKNSAAKRVNMFLRWMVREGPVDFRLWKSIQPSQLLIPLDVHTGNVSRVLGLLKRKQNDRKAVEELSKELSKFDPKDPIKYDFALFGIGAYEKSTLLLPRN